MYTLSFHLAFNFWYAAILEFGIHTIYNTGEGKVIWFRQGRRPVDCHDDRTMIVMSTDYQVLLTRAKYTISRITMVTSAQKTPIGVNTLRIISTVVQS